MLPSDPQILLSMINMKLRDEYDSLEALADGLEVDINEIKEKLKNAGYAYNADTNQFR